MNADCVIVGLGNPGRQYAFTRHNIGFLLLDVLAQDFGDKFSLQKNLNAEALEVSSFASKRCILLKPLTFMNLSGESVQKLYQKHHHLREKPLIVVHDEVDLPLGKLRFKQGGGDAGHNGLKSIRAALGHGEFYRLRLGVGRPTEESGRPLRDYVLETFAKSEETLLGKVIDQGIQSLEAFLTQDLTAAQAVASREDKG